MCGVGRAAVGKYLKEHKEGGGVLRSALPRGPVKKDPMKIALKSEMPNGETLYDAILGRVEAAHREGRVNTSRNLLRYLTVDADGPPPPGRFCARFQEEIEADGDILRKGEKGFGGGEAKAVYSEMDAELLQEAGCPARRRKT